MEWSLKKKKKKKSLGGNLTSLDVHNFLPFVLLFLAELRTGSTKKA